MSILNRIRVGAIHIVGSNITIQIRKGREAHIRLSGLEPIA